MALIGVQPSLAIIEIVNDGADWVKRERWWIAYYRAQHADLLNISEGGDGTCGVQRTPEQRAAQSARQKGKPSPKRGLKASPEACLAQSIAHKARHERIIAEKYASIYMEQAAKEWLALPAALRKPSKAPTQLKRLRQPKEPKPLKQRGPMPAEQRAKIGAATSIALRGRTLPPEVRAKVSAKLLGIPKSPETIERMKAAQKGRVKSPEHRAKIAATLKAKAMTDSVYAAHLNQMASAGRLARWGEREAIIG